MNTDLMKLLQEIRVRIATINHCSPYAFVLFLKEKELLRTVLTDLPGAADKPGVYHNPFTVKGYREGDLTHKEVLLNFEKELTLRAIDDTIFEFSGEHKESLAA